MSDDTRHLILLVASFVFFFMLILGALFVEQRQDDHYCLVTPLERLDRKRCGL